MKVRHAVAGDLPAIRDMITAMHAESVYRHVALDPGKLEAFVRFATEDPAHAVIVYEGSAGRLDGVYMGNLGDYFFSNEVGAWDLIFYVRPERRGSMCAARLWRAFRDWAAEKGARTIWPGISTGVLQDRSDRFYRGMGLERVGSVFFQRL